MRWLTTLLVIVACGGDENGGPAGPDPSGGGRGSMTATIDGNIPFNGVVGQSAELDADGLFAIGASQTAAGSSRTLGFALYTNGVGTYTSTGTTGLNAVYIEVAAGSSVGAGWSMSLFSGSGSVTISELSQTRAKGTFTFSMPAATGPATGTKTISGSFDAELRR